MGEPQQSRSQQKPFGIRLQATLTGPEERAIDVKEDSQFATILRYYVFVLAGRGGHRALSYLMQCSVVLWVRAFIGNGQVEHQLLNTKRITLRPLYPQIVT